MTQVAIREEQNIVAVEPASIMEVIAKAASDPTTDVGKLERLLGMYERVTAQQAQQRFNAAMTAVQNETRPIAADANNPQTRSKYASYTALDRVLRPIYTRHGFALSFDTGEGAPENCVKVLCHVSHSDGHSRTYHVDMPADGKGAKGGDVMTRTHATGAAMTYGQRYLLKLIFNVAVGEDDDGNRASAGGASISDDQVEKIFDLIKLTKADTAKFCKHFGVEAVPDLKAKDFERAVTALNLKAKAVAQ
jgi:hypothetical protein